MASDDGAFIGHRRLSRLGVATVAVLALSCGPAQAKPAPWSGRVFTVAGNGTHGRLVLGGAATAASIGPYSVASDGSGGFYVSDASHNRVLRVSRFGVVSLVAGNGTGHYSGDGGPAVDAGMEPTEISPTSTGDLLVADGFFNNRIREIRSDGVIVTVAGGGTVPESQQQDGTPASQAQLNGPLGVASEREGGFLIAETFGSRILRVLPDGTLRIVAGGGSPRRHARLAMHAILDHPLDTHPLPGGGFLIADTDANRVRRVLPNGVIRTVAGNGRTCLRTEPNCKLAPVNDRPMPALKEQLDGPSQAVPYGPGSFLVADNGHGRILKVNAGGTATTIAGCGRIAFSPDGMPANETCFDGIGGIVRLPDGGLLFATGLRVRYIAPQHPSLMAVAVAAGQPRQATSMASVRYLVTRAGSYDLRIFKHGKQLFMRTGVIRAGSGRLAIRQRLRPGRYVAELTVHTPTGQRAQQSVVLIVDAMSFPSGLG